MRALSDAGFEISEVKNRRDFALGFYRQLREKTLVNDSPPSLSLHTLMQDSTSTKIKNMINGIAEGLIAPVEVIARKR